MKSGKIMAYGACVLLGLALAAVSPRAETLASAVNDALRTYPDIEAALASRAAAEDELVASSAARKPRVDLAARTSAYRSSSSHGDAVAISLSANQSIYDGGANAADQLQRHAELDAEAQRVIDQAIEIGQQAVIAYVQVLQSRDNLVASGRNFDSLSDIARRVDLRVKAGFGADTDLLDVQLKLQTAKLQLIDAKDQAARAEIAYRNVVGRSPIALKPVRFPVEGLPPDVETAVQLARDHSPKVRALIYDAQAADAATSGVLAAERPQLDLNLGVNHNQDVVTSWEDTQDVSARLTLSVNLFDGGLTKARARKARHQAYASRYRAKSTGLALEQRVRLAWAEMEAGRQRSTVLNQQQKTARRSLELYLKRFDAGVEPLQRILDVQSQSAAADLARVSADYGNLLTGFGLLAGTGGLLPALGINFDSGAAPRG
jgi:outer membrane protein, adhesin transport system